MLTVLRDNYFMHISKPCKNPSTSDLDNGGGELNTGAFAAPRSIGFQIWWARFASSVFLVISPLETNQDPFNDCESFPSLRSGFVRIVSFLL
jgi:hypothetical protein